MKTQPIVEVEYGAKYLTLESLCCKTERYCIPVERLSLRVCTDKGRLITTSAMMMRRIVKPKKASDNMPLKGEVGLQNIAQWWLLQS